MKIKVDHTRCQGHARCFSLAPHIFELDDAGYILPGDIEVNPGDELMASRSAKSCPERALSVMGDDDAV